MDIPEQWRGYPCADYFASQYALSGFWDEPSQLWLIEPAERVEEDRDAGFLQVGRPGVDDIGLGYRNGEPDFWAFHRMVWPDFQYLAPTVQDFIEGWFAGRITL